MHDLENLPKTVVCDGTLYSIALYVTAWNKFCLCYKRMFPSTEMKGSFKDTIISEVVEPNMTTKPEFSEHVYDIVDTPNILSAIDMFKRRLKDGLHKGTITIYQP